MPPELLHLTRTWLNPPWLGLLSFPVPLSVLFLFFSLGIFLSNLLFHKFSSESLLLQSPNLR